MPVNRTHHPESTALTDPEEIRLYNPTVVDMIIDPRSVKFIPAVTKPNLIMLEDLTGQYTGVSVRAWNSLEKVSMDNEQVHESAVIDTNPSVPKVLGYHAARFSLLVEYLNGGGISKVKGFSTQCLVLLNTAERNLYLPR